MEVLTVAFAAEDSKKGGLQNQTSTNGSDTLERKLEEAREQKSSLVIILGKPLGKQFALGLDNMVIGRQPECDICIADDSISRAHAEISKDHNKECSVTDLDSTNGTYLNDKRIKPKERVTLKDGDLLKVGNVILKFVAEGSIDNVFHSDMFNLAMFDDLTGIYNRKSIMDALEIEFKKAKMSNNFFSIITFDLDRLKWINDIYGHAAGDFALEETVETIKTALREGDLFGRVGGDEFLIILERTNLSDACFIAERIRADIEGHDCIYEGHEIPLTISLGVWSPDFTIQSAENLYMRADEALYKAKNNGGNKVAAY
jgi:diguanylate cyclase (GGDEF)-like protein